MGILCMKRHISGRPRINGTGMLMFGTERSKTENRDDLFTRDIDQSTWNSP